MSRQIEVSDDRTQSKAALPEAKGFIQPAELRALKKAVNAILREQRGLL